MKEKFIVASDKKTADEMITMGFVCISQIGNTYTFLNNLPDNIITFDNKKVYYTDILNV